MEAKTLLLALVAFVVFACGGEKSETSTSSEEDASTIAEAVEETVEKTGAYEFLANAEEAPCDALTMKMIKAVMNPSAEITKDDSYGCNYTWERPNSEEIREQQRKAPIKDMMKFKPEFLVGLMVSDAGGITPERFMPKKMSESQKKQIEEQTAEKVDEEDLSEEQKEMGKDFTKKLVDKVNNTEFTPVEGVGDAAYWNPLGGGNLMVLAGDKILTLEVFVDEDFDANLAKAKELAQKILQQ